jgi:AmmeMemoRadiSam system protein A
MPHAPVLVPPVSGVRGDAADSSRRAMRQAAECVMSRHPETLVVISPHAPRKPHAFGFWSDDCLHGSFAQFGAPEVQVTLPNDRELTNTIMAEARARDLATWPIRKHSLDHGALVPLWFLAEAGWSGPTVVLGPDYPDDGGQALLGEAIAAATRARQCRVAIIASGDMSHRLTANAPCGFHPQAHVFDEAFIRLLRSGDYGEIANLNSDLREHAAEDAVDSTLIALAATGWDTTGHRVLNYQGPFGVGYGVAVLYAQAPESSRAESDPPGSVETSGAMLPDLARRSVKAALSGSLELPPDALDNYLATPHGVFVTLREQDGRLRGCVGTVEPVCANVVAETWRNARLAAFQDPRFTPVMTRELNRLRFHVSVIHSVKEIASEEELCPQRYGVVVSTEDGRRGVLLPGMKEIQTGEQQLALARGKGGIDLFEPVKLQRFEIDQFTERAGEAAA